MQSVAKWVRDHKYSLREFGALCGISRAYAGEILRGQKTPTPQLLRVIHERTGIPCDTLIRDCTEPVSPLPTVYVA